MRVLSIIMVFLASFGGIQSSLNAQGGDFNVVYNELLAKYVMDGKVDYAALKESSKELNYLVEKIGNHEVKDLRYGFSFYLNAYNILVVSQIVENYPITSPMDVDGFFDKTKFLVAGESMTLNSLENDLIRPKYGDSRIHFALVCGAIGCPPLASQAFTPENYHKLLGERTRMALNNPSFVQIDTETETVAYSKIFEWYMVDFGGTDRDVWAYVNRQRKEAVPEHYSIEYYEYDWTLNKK